MSPPDYGRSLKPGIGFNLLVRDVKRSVEFAEKVLGATATYADEDFAVLRLNGSEWMLHADHTYSDNPLAGVIAGSEARGAGVELAFTDAIRIWRRPGRATMGSSILAGKHG